MNVLRGLYIWTLASLLILAGCLGGGVIDDGEGQSGTDDTTGSGATTGSTTVINNYHNNTTVVHEHYYTYDNSTTTEIITETPELIALGGTFHDDGENTTMHYQTYYTLNTTAGQMLMVNYYALQTDLGEFAIMKIITNCEGDIDFWAYPSSGTAISGSAFNCTHSLDIANGYVDAQTITWSLVYSILPVTVG